MVRNANHDSRRPLNQGDFAVIGKPNKIKANTHFDFKDNLTAYGGLLPVATMLEKLRFQRLLEETLTIKHKG